MPPATSTVKDIDALPGFWWFMSEWRTAEMPLLGHRDEGTQPGQGRLKTLIGHAYQCSGKYHLYFSVT